MFNLDGMDKLDIIIFLLLFIIIAGILKFIFKFIHGRMTGATQAHIISAMIDKGYYDGALSKCNRFIINRPNDTSLLWFRATLLFKLGKITEAKSAFEKLLAEEPLWQEDAEKYLKNIQSKT